MIMNEKNYLKELSTSFVNNNYSKNSRNVLVKPLRRITIDYQPNLEQLVLLGYHTYNLHVHPEGSAFSEIIIFFLVSCLTLLTQVSI